MMRSYVYLTLFVYLFASSWAYIVEEDGHWPWTHVKHLTRANWTSSLKANDPSSKLHHSVWFVFHYLTYCDFCKKAKPGWDAAAQYAAGWSRYIKIGAYDCAGEKESQTDICEDEGYPQWRIFCPLTNSTQLAFETGLRVATTKPEEILMWSIKKINKIAPHCYGKSWPIRQALEPQTKEDLNRLIPRSVKKFQLFVTDDVLLYSLYVLNNSKTVFKEPIYRLATDNRITQDGVLWKGMRNDDGRISIEQIDSTRAMQPFELPEHHESHTDEPEQKKPDAIKPTLTDVDSAVVWMINKDLRRKLSSQFESIKTWLQVLHTYYPGSETIHRFLHDLMEFMSTRTAVSSKELQDYINATSVIKLPEVQFVHCNGSDPSKRGYPCALWVLFHSMTVKQAILAEQNQLPSSVKPSDLIVSIREYIRTFFLCDECSKHFVNMTRDAESEVTSYKESVLYLWRSHNTVNERVRNDETTTDPLWPKVPFPTERECHACVRQIDGNGDALEHDEDATYNYLKEYYNLQMISGKKSSDAHQPYNYVSILLLVLSSVFSFVV